MRLGAAGEALEAEFIKWRYEKMIKRIAIPMVAALMLAGIGSAYATPERGDAGDARYDELSHCQNLAAKFDMYSMRHEGAKHMARAKELRSEGMEACTNDDFMHGVHSLEQALLDIGVTPAPASYF